MKNRAEQNAIIQRVVQTLNPADLTKFVLRTELVVKTFAPERVVEEFKEVVKSVLERKHESSDVQAMRVLVNDVPEKEESKAIPENQSVDVSTPAQSTQAVAPVAKNTSEMSLEEEKYFDERMKLLPGASMAFTQAWKVKVVEDLMKRKERKSADKFLNAMKSELIATVNDIRNLEKRMSTMGVKLSSEALLLVESLNLLLCVEEDLKMLQRHNEMMIMAKGVDRSSMTSEEMKYHQTAQLVIKGFQDEYYQQRSQRAKRIEVDLHHPYSRDYLRDSEQSLQSRGRAALDAWVFKSPSDVRRFYELLTRFNSEITEAEKQKEVETILQAIQEDLEKQRLPQVAPALSENPKPLDQMSFEEKVRHFDERLSRLSDKARIQFDVLMRLQLFDLLDKKCRVLQIRKKYHQQMLDDYRKTLDSLPEPIWAFKDVEVLFGDYEKRRSQYEKPRGLNFDARSILDVLFSYLRIVEVFENGHKRNAEYRQQRSDSPLIDEQKNYHRAAREILVNMMKPVYGNIFFETDSLYVKELYAFHEKLWIDTFDLGIRDDEDFKRLAMSLLGNGEDDAAKVTRMLETVHSKIAAAEEPKESSPPAAERRASIVERTLEQVTNSFDQSIRPILLQWLNDGHIAAALNSSHPESLAQAQPIKDLIREEGNAYLKMCREFSSAADVDAFFIQLIARFDRDAQLKLSEGKAAEVLNLRKAIAVLGVCQNTFVAVAQNLERKSAQSSDQEGRRAFIVGHPPEQAAAIEKQLEGSGIKVVQVPKLPEADSDLFFSPDLSDFSPQRQIYVRRVLERVMTSFFGAMRWFFQDRAIELGIAESDILTQNVRTLLERSLACLRDRNAQSDDAQFLHQFWSDFREVFLPEAAQKMANDLNTFFEKHGK